MAAQSEYIDESFSISAGKFRRYHGAGLKQILDIPTIAKNTRDFAYVNAGIIQSLRLLKKIKPSAVFIKGGFVGLPVGLAAAKLKIPFITHDSDAVPGLANRMIAKWATLHAVAMPIELYNYPKQKTVYVGVPISSEYVKVSQRQMDEFKRDLGLDAKNQVVLVTGGGLGAKRLNLAVENMSEELLKLNHELILIHLTGAGLLNEANSYYDNNLSDDLRSRIKVVGFTNELYRYSGAADVIISRAGATTIAEFASQSKACIVVPNPQLTGGHQTKNAQHLEKSGAVKVVSEEDLSNNYNVLLDTTIKLLADKTARDSLASKLHEYSRSSAAKDLADRILEVAEHEV